MHHFGRLPIVLLLFGGMMAYRIWRMSHRANAPSGLRLDRLWVMPAIVCGLAVLALVHTHLHGKQWFILLLAAGLGAALGWWRGGQVRISINPRTNQLMQHASPVVFYVVIGLFALRFGMRFLAFGTGAGRAAFHIASALILFTCAMISVQRLEMYLRARRLLAGHAATPVPPIFPRRSDK